MMAFPKKKWCHNKPATNAPNAPEASLQSFTNDYLVMKGLRCLRIPDGFFRWVKMNAPPHIQAAFFKIFAALPDNLVLIPFGDYLLGVPIELKTATGKLHGKQKSRAEEQHWKVCRSGQEVIGVIEQAENFKTSLGARGNYVST